MDTQSLNQKGITCPKCHKRFDSAQALRMHHVRMHTRAGLRGAKLGGLAAQEVNRKKHGGTTYKQSVYQRAKARYAARGLNAHGQPFKRPPFEPLVYNPTVGAGTVSTHVKYCPNCGESLEKYNNI